MPQKILIIDDSRTMREVLKVYLMGGRYGFLEAESGARALDILRLELVELVIADINMPAMDGFAFVRAMRANLMPRVRTVPIILITSDKSEEIRDRVKDAHVDAFLGKPVDAGELVAAVEKILGLQGLPSSRGATAWASGPPEARELGREPRIDALHGKRVTAKDPVDSVDKLPHAPGPPSSRRR